MRCPRPMSFQKFWNFGKTFSWYRYIICHHEWPTNPKFGIFCPGYWSVFRSPFDMLADHPLIAPWSKERKAMQKKWIIFNIATPAITDNKVDSDLDDFLDLWREKPMKYNVYNEIKVSFNLFWFVSIWFNN